MDPSKVSATQKKRWLSNKSLPVLLYSLSSVVFVRVYSSLSQNKGNTDKYKAKRERVTMIFYEYAFTLLVSKIDILLETRSLPLRLNHFFHIDALLA